jgi:hypothetical protein
MHEVLDQAGLEPLRQLTGSSHIRPMPGLSMPLRAKLGLPAERVIMTVADHANTSAASVPLALDVADPRWPDQAGDLVILEAMGGGFTWGASLVGCETICDCHALVILQHS